MFNTTEDGNQTTTPELFCTHGLHETQQKIPFSVFNILLCIPAILGNILVIVALRKVSCPRLYPPSKLLLGCLASTDVCVGLIAEPLYVVYIMLPEQSRHCFFVKIIANTATTIFGLVSLLTLTTISIDRVLALMLGLRYRNVVTLKRVRVCVVTFWLFSFAVSMISLYYFRTALGIICILLLLCMAISGFCYTKIYVTLNRYREAQMQHDIHQKQHNEKRITVNIARYRKTVSTALWVQLMLLICYLPYGIVIAVHVYTGKRSPSHDLWWAATLSFFYLNSSLNPILYCWRIMEIRKAVKETVGQFC